MTGPKYPLITQETLDLLNPRARRVIEHAARLSRRYDDGYIGSEHLLLAIAQPDNGMGWSFLQMFGCADTVREAIEKFLESQQEKRRRGETSD